MQSLPEAARSVLVLREYGGLSYQEIASVLDVPVGTVMSRLNYARNRLREILRGCMWQERRANMHEEMRTLLNAYLDGELHGRRLQEMETHLAICAACRDELSELRLVSDLLQADPAPEFMPAERFVSQLTLRLPRRSLHDQPVETRLRWPGGSSRPGCWEPGSSCRQYLP